MFNLRKKHDNFFPELKLPVTKLNLVSGIVIKMSANEPVIKFSPFEALLIGEKNKVLKRQPMKNTIFVTRLNQKSKTINLRDLFDLEKDTTNSKSNDVIFKIPQRVRDFLKNKKITYKKTKPGDNKKEDLLCYEFEGHKMIVRSNDSVKPKYKKSKVKSNKVKFKQKCTGFKGNVNEKVVNKFQISLRNHSKTRRSNLIKRNSGIRKIVLNKSHKNTCNVNKHLLRGKDGRFVGKEDYARLNQKEVNSNIKQKYLSNYICKFYVKNRNIFTNDKESKNNNFKKSQMPYVLENIVGLSKWCKQFDLSTPEILLNEISRHNCKYNCHKDFKFPKYPEQIDRVSDFENDENLLDIIYENFPKSLKFESKDSSSDFISALRNAKIIEPEKHLEIKQNPKEIKLNFGNRTPYIKLERLDAIGISACRPLQSIKNDYITSAHDFNTKQNHLITAKNCRSLFIKNPEGNDIFVSNLVKPFLHKSWVGSLKQF